MTCGRAVAMAVVLALAACTGSTDTGPPPVVLTGSWGYAGTQVVPTAQLVGTLVVSSQAGHTFSGIFSATQSGFGIPTAVLNGTVQGTAVSGDALDFNVIVNGVTRRHFGLIHGDSVVGNWQDQDNTSGLAGSFRMRHLSTP